MRKMSYALFLILLFSSLIFALGEESSPASIKLKVTASVANIRNGPSLNNKIIMQVKAGTVLNATEKQGNWYLVVLSKQGIEPALRGYIHQSIVAVIFESESIPEPSKADPEEHPIEKISPPISEKKPEPEPEPKLEPPQYPKNVHSNKMYIRASCSMGFLEETSSKTWQETIYHETASASVSYNIKKGNFFSAAFGYRVYGPISLELGVDITSRNIDGTYSASIPHPLLFGLLRDGEGIESYELSENSIFLNLVYSFRSGRFGLDFSAGPAYILSKAKIISGINYNDTYPYNSVTLSTNSTDVSKNVLGFNGGAHVLFYLTENFAIDLNGHYLSGKTDFETGTAVPGHKITLGGLRAGAGLKIQF